MITDDGDFVLNDCHGRERFRFVLAKQTLFIRVGENGENKRFSFIADVTEARELRNWLTELLEPTT